MSPGCTEVNVVWFKRDLRLHDHDPLKAAVAAGKPLILMYCFEPSIMASDDWDVRHGRFIQQALADMQQGLKVRGGKLLVLHREVIAALESIRKEFSVQALYSQQETGTQLTFDRDIALGDYCREQGLPWHEYAADGVVRRLKNRKNWVKRWYDFMEQAPADPDWATATFAEWTEAQVQPWRGPALPAAFFESDPQMQPGGTTYGRRYLDSFLRLRHRSYNLHLSKPVASRKSCARISPYLAWGCLSMREIVQRLKQTPSAHQWHLESFFSRLRWRSHYIQKLEQDVSLETRNLNRGYPDLGQVVIPERIRAWEEGRTGIPLVDASMRCVAATGYLNFRMRAMVVSFFSHQLWQPWQIAARYLARQFLDYEPGIHYAQHQMQAGVVGTHIIRVYNPIKQAADHDPEAEFISRWVPELAGLPPALAREPWTMTAMEEMLYNFERGVDYPEPIVDEEASRVHARDVLHRMRDLPAVREDSARIIRMLSNPGRQT
ncbi:MAG: deoxyribodipyrimidine photo-lyase [Bacteroidota bacterium]